MSTTDMAAEEAERALLFKTAESVVALYGSLSPLERLPGTRRMIEQLLNLLNHVQETELRRKRNGG